MDTNAILTPTQRRQRNRQEVISNALEISRALMRENGVAALSFNEIARQLGMKPPSLYAYFSNKMAIYDALFRHGMEIFAKGMTESCVESGTPTERLQRIMDAYMTFAIENPEFYRLIFERPIPGFRPSEENMAFSSAALEEAVKAFALLVEDSGIDMDLPLNTAFDLAIGIMHGLTAQHMANEPELPIGQGRFGSLNTYGAQMFMKAWPIKR